MRYLILFLALVLCTPLAAATLKVGSRGTVIVTVPAAQYINVFSSGSFSGPGGSTLVSKEIGGPSSSSSRRFVLETNGDVRDEEVSFGPYTNATRVRIEAGADGALYSVGAGALQIPVSLVSPSLVPGRGSVFRIASRVVRLQPVPTAMTTAATITSAGLLTGIIVGTHTAGATAAYTLPTGTLLEAAVPDLQIGEGFEWVLINDSAAAADSITVTAGTDHTIVGAPIVISKHVTTGGAITSMGCNSSSWITKKTAANTFVTYRKN